MSDFEGLPDSRSSLRGLTAEGDEAWLIRGIAAKLYRCPGCHGEVEIGSDHVIVHFVRRPGGSDHHHWHRRCAEEILLGELRGVRPVSATESDRKRLERRASRPAGRRRRR
jgi:hypothetical protein